MFNRNVIVGAAKVCLKFKQPLPQILAIAQAESNGVAGASVNFTDYRGNHIKATLPLIRAEGHIFHRRLSAKAKSKNPAVAREYAEKLRQAVRAGLANPKMGGLPNPKSQSARYELLAKMMRIDAETAIESFSYGLGQVMGFHWDALKYSSALEFYKHQIEAGVAGQIETMLRFIVYVGKLSAAVAAKDFPAVAKGYNGSAYAVNAYDVKMARFTRQWEAYLSANPVTKAELAGIKSETELAGVASKGLSIGDKKAQVKTLQIALVTLAFDKINTVPTNEEAEVWSKVLDLIEIDDGILGPATAASILAVQRFLNLKETGVADPDFVKIVTEEIKSVKTESGIKARNHFTVTKSKRKEYEQTILHKSVPTPTPKPIPVEEPIQEPPIVEQVPSSLPVEPTIEVEDVSPTDPLPVPQEDTSSTEITETEEEKPPGIKKAMTALIAVFVALLASLWEWVKDLVSGIYEMVLSVIHWFV